jgi:hypothetical protein
MLAVGRGGAASKTEAMYFPSPRQIYTDENTSNFPVDDTGSISLTESFRYLGSIIHYSLTSDADVDYRISKASAAFGALSNVLRNKHVSNHLKGEVYKALVLSTLLYGCEVWCLREDLFNRLRSFHKRCVRRCVVSAFAMPFIITLVQPLFFKGSMSWTLVATITIGFFVGLGTSLGCL